MTPNKIYVFHLAENMLNEIQNYLQIDAHLSTGGQPTSVQLEEVARSGFQVVINLAPIHANYSLPDEKGFVEKLGMGYVHIPVKWSQPTDVDFRRFSDAMQANSHKRVFAHCAANYRVSSFVTIYRILYQGCEKEVALQDLHRIWTPNDTWQAFIDRILASGPPDHTSETVNDP